MLERVSGGKEFKAHSHVHLHVYDGKTKIVYRECEGYRINTDCFGADKIGYRYEIIDENGQQIQGIITSVNNYAWFHILDEDEEFMRTALETGNGVVVYQKKQERK